MVLIESTRDNYKVISHDDVRKLVHVRKKRIDELISLGYSIGERDSDTNTIELKSRGRKRIFLIIASQIVTIKKHENRNRNFSR